MSENKIQPKINPNADVVNQYTGEKWYYSDIVKEHFFNPRNLMLEEPDESQYDAVGMVGSPACLSGSTPIITNPSVRTIDTMEVGEKVLGHDSKYHFVERVFRVSYKPQKLIRIKNYLGEVLATEDHLIFAKQIPKTATYRHHEYKTKIPSAWAHAGDLERGDIALYPLPLEVRRLMEVDFFSTRKNWDFKSRALPASLPASADLFELFGYFIAEGHTKEGKEVGLTFSEKEMHLADRVKNLVKKFFDLKTTIRVRPAQHRLDVTVCNTNLANNFRRMFGSSAATKKIPEEFLFCDPKIQRGLIKGLWRGDGYFATWRSQPRAGFTTISPTLFQHMRFLLLRQRIILSLFKEEEKIKKGVLHQKSYRLHVGDMDSLERLAYIIGVSFRRDPHKRHERRAWFEDNYLCLPIKKVERVSFAGGRLYNFDVEKSRTYATDAFLVHNCGDMMKMWLKIDRDGECVQEMKWRTFGCGSAIAATSMFSVMVTENGGMPLGDALKIRPQDIMERLGGLPNRKIHCSVLADKAFRKAANEYFRRTGQTSRIIIDGAKVIDPTLNITDKDIEEAVLEGAIDLDGVQKKLKVGIGSPEIIPEVEQLIRFYKEKYYG